MTDIPISSPRDRILQTALTRFYADDIRVGIDRIIAEAGVAKASFYRYFPAKDDLVEAFLEARHERWMTWFNGRIDALCAEQPASIALAAIALGEWFADAGFRGCAFINAMADSGLTPRCVAVVQRHTDAVMECLERLALRADSAVPREAAEEALLVIEGAIVRAQMTADPEVANVAARMLARLDGKSG
jgi:AcrR family transcriptional regulator